MDNAKSRAAKVLEHTARFNRFLHEMNDLKKIISKFQKIIEADFDRGEVYCLERRPIYFNFMKKQITDDTHKWARKMKKDQLLLEEVVGECDQNYYWMFEGCGIEWLTERYWQGHEGYVYDFPETPMTDEERQAQISKNKANVVSVLTEVAYLENSLSEKRCDFLEQQLKSTRYYAHQWGKQWREDKELIESISVDVSDFEWIFED